MKKFARFIALFVAACLLISLSCAAFAATEPLEEMLSIIDDSIAKAERIVFTLDKKHSEDELFNLVTMDNFLIFNMALEDTLYSLHDFKKKSDPNAMVYKNFMEKDGVYTFSDVLVNETFRADFSLSYIYAPAANYVRCDVTGTGKGREIDITSEMLKKGSAVYVQLHNNIDGIVTKYLLSKNSYQVADFDEDDPIAFKSLASAPKSDFKSWNAFAKGSYVSFTIKDKTLSVLLFDKKYTYK